VRVHDRAAGVTSSGRREDQEIAGGRRRANDSTAVAVRDATEARKQWRRGFDAARADAVAELLHGEDRDGRPSIGRQALEQIAFELVLLRAVAKRLGEKADYWMRRADELQIEATYWHSIAARAGEVLQ
jgi:hypothetical protein